jgi:hypothetical protein
MEHEFHSLAEMPLSAKFHGEPAWSALESGVKFIDVPDAPPPAASQPQRQLQMRALAKEFAGLGKFGASPSDVSLRLLPQPLYRYEAPQEGVLAGGLFAFVRATDPEILLVIEARGTATEARWQFAAARMHSTAALRLEHDEKRVWQAESLSVEEIFQKHTSPYTAYKFKQIPEFLTKAASGRLDQP